MHVTKILAAAAIAAIGVTTAASADPIATREKLMWANGGAASALFPMAKGETEFDARVAAIGFQSLNAVALTFGDYFPEGSQNNSGKFYASPKIWEDRAGFDAEVAKFIEVTQAGMDAKPQDKDALMAVLGPVGQVCTSCHEGYRVKGE